MDKTRSDKSGNLYEEWEKFQNFVSNYFNSKDISKLFEIDGLKNYIEEQQNWFPPEYVYKFISNLAKDINTQKVLDPWINLLSPSNYINYEDLTGITLSQFEQKIMTKLNKQRLKLIVDDTLDNIKTLENDYDLVLSFPPFGLKTPLLIKDSLSNDVSTSLIIESGRLLKTKGKMIFLTSQNICSSSRVKKLLMDNNIFIDAVFSLPAGTLRPKSYIASNLVLFSKKRTDLTFVAELSDNINTNNQILENYIQHKEGKIEQLGALIDINEFKTFDILQASRKLSKLKKRYNFPEYKLKDIALSINLLENDKVENITEPNNAIYIHKAGKGKVVNNLSEMIFAPKGYYQIILNEKYANSIYMANYLNSDIGTKLIESEMIGSLIPQLYKNKLSELCIMLPDFDTQIALESVNNKIDTILLQLHEMKSSLWNFPKKLQEISKQLVTINNEETLTTWINKLPFPISSILWCYYSTLDSTKKIDHLFHFYEAFSEFLSMLKLSIIAQDKQQYARDCYRWLDKEVKFHDWYKRTTFGSWNTINYRISKYLRELLGNKKMNDHVLNIMGNPSKSFINMLLDSNINNILKDVSIYRNKWKGHSGVVNKTEEENRLNKLEENLNKLRNIIADSFDEVTIISPLKNEYCDGIYLYSAKELIGTNTIFNEIEIKSVIPLDKKKLYLVQSSNNRPIELLPLIKYSESYNAFYYYSSIESGSVRWISYHFTNKSELEEPVNKSIESFLKLLKLD